MSHAQTSRRRLSLAPVIVLAGACAGDFQTPPPPDLGPSPDITVFACQTVDVLFVVDNSNSMEAEQKNLVANFPRFISRLESVAPDLRTYHVGVISTDIGAGAHTIGTCAPPGDEGRLQHAGRGAGCAADFPKRYLEGPSPTIAEDFACVAELGLDGCGYEQQLEAALKALSAQPYNDGFLRNNAPLAIVFISDEDDCSAWDTNLFDPADVATYGDLRTRCVKHPDKLHPVSRYIEGFKKLKSDPRRVVVAAITGPAGEILYDNAYPDTVTPVCNSAELGDANPGNRFAELIQGFGPQGIHQSICQGDMAGALDGIADAIETVCLD